MQKCRRIEAEPGGANQSLRQRQAVERENVIDRELGAAAIAGFADVEALGKQRVEHGRRVGRDLFVAADEADAIALANLLAGTRHRRFQKAQAISHSGGERRDPIRVAGRGAEHDLARAPPGSSACSTTSST